MIVGTGIDLLFVPRLLRLLTRSDRAPYLFARRILSPHEFALWDQLKTKDVTKHARFLGVRWAVKEATYKALSAHVYLSWKDVSMVHDGKGRPSVVFEKEELRRFHPVVSVSHDGEYIVAQVLVTKTT